MKMALSSGPAAATGPAPAARDGQGGRSGQGGQVEPGARSVAAGARAQPVTITIDQDARGPVVPEDFAGLSFERGPLNPGNAGVAGYLFNPENTSLINLFRTVGLRNLRIGGGSIDFYIPAGTGSDGFTGIDNLFAFAAAAEVRVIYSLRLLSPADKPVNDLESINARAAGYIWDRYRQHVASFAIGNEPDWHAFHTYAGHPADPAIYEETSGVPGSAYPSYLARWRTLAQAVTAAAPGAPLCGPDTGAYTSLTYTPDPDGGVSWTERFATDLPCQQITDITQHHYAGASPGTTTAEQAIASMLSAEWLDDTEIGTGPAGTTYIPYPWLYRNNLAAVRATGLGYRMTEANDYLGGVAGASNAFASALWSLDYLHWWAARGAAGVNFHNKQWLLTDTIIPDPAAHGGYKITPKGYGIKAFTLGSAGRVKPIRTAKPDGLNLTAYCVGTAEDDYVTIINKTYGHDAADAEVTIIPPSPGPRRAQVMTLACGQPSDAAGAGATLGGAVITGDTGWNGTWSDAPDAGNAGIRLTVYATTATVVKIRSRR